MPKIEMNININRRQVLQYGLAGGVGAGLVAKQISVPLVMSDSGPGVYGELQAADANGLRLPLGFSSRVVATTGQPVGDSGFLWHSAPDGGATFPSADGGWIYISNSERSSARGGVGAIRFAANGEIMDAYSILSGTTYNCAGGPTPWGTWLSCEETSNGLVYECDPLVPNSQGIARPHLGRFTHEAAAVDPVHQHIYLTEDRGNGLLYRFVPSSYPNLDAGELHAAEILDPLGEGPIQLGQIRGLHWHVVPDPMRLGSVSTRNQVSQATAFNGGEGCWYEGGLVYFATKGDDKVWKIDTVKNEISIVYDAASFTNPVLTGIDNVFVVPTGDVFVAEDTGDMQIVALTSAGGVIPIVQLEGVSGSEICGPALSPDGTRLYFSSQRNPGQTFEVTGPWLRIPLRPTSHVPTLGLFVAGFLGTVVAAYGGIRARLKSTT